MNTNRLAWQSLETSARNTLAWARGLYRAARAPRGAAGIAHLDNWQWLCTSAEACVEEARRLYLEGLESLLSTGVSVRREDQEGKARFVCQALDDDTTGCVTFENDAPYAAKAVLERLFSSSEQDVLQAFGRGLSRLDVLGAFAENAVLELRPDPPAHTPLLLDDAARRRPGALRRFRQRQIVALPLRQA